LDLSPSGVSHDESLLRLGNRNVQLSSGSVSAAATLKSAIDGDPSNAIVQDGRSLIP
jgi:hypothetical protein